MRAVAVAAGVRSTCVPAWRIEAHPRHDAARAAGAGTAARARLRALALLCQGPRTRAHGAPPGAGRRICQRRWRSTATTLRPASDISVDGREHRSPPTRCCCTRAWCPTSISPTPPDARSRGMSCRRALRPVVDAGAAPRFPASSSRATARALPARGGAEARGRLAALAVANALGRIDSDARAIARATASCGARRCHAGPRVSRHAYRPRTRSACPRATRWCAAARRWPRSGHRAGSRARLRRAQPDEGATCAAAWVRARAASAA